MKDVYLCSDHEALKQIVGKTVLKVDYWDVYFTDGTRLELGVRHAYGEGYVEGYLYGPKPPKVTT